MTGEATAPKKVMPTLVTVALAVGRMLLARTSNFALCHSRKSRGKRRPSSVFTWINTSSGKLHPCYGMQCLCFESRMENGEYDAAGELCGATYKRWNTSLHQIFAPRGAGRWRIVGTNC